MHFPGGEHINEFSEAPPKPPRADPIAGELFTETFDYDGGRPVTMYVPPHPPEAIVFAVDGQMIAPWGGLLEVADVPPTMIVGAHRAATRRCGSTSIRRASTRNGLPPMSGFSSRRSVRGCGRASG